MEKQPLHGMPFRKRVYLLRTIGWSTGFFCVSNVLFSTGTSLPIWLALLFTTLIWPHFAYFRALRSQRPARSEINNLLVDALWTGFWGAAMGFNLVPTATLIIIAGMNNMVAGGGKLYLKGSLAQIVGIMVAIALTGFHPQIESDTINILTSLPMLAIYPLFLGLLTYRLSIRLGEQNKKLEVLSRTDGLSGLFNRHFWERTLEAEFQRFRRGGPPCSLILLDIDHFKQINDTLGHVIGDQIIQLVATTLKQGVRTYDIAGRYGGDEFGIILPSTSAVDAVKVAERLKTSVMRSGANDLLTKPCTISIGIAELSSRVGNTEEWISMADQALYQAKQNGRNGWSLFPVQIPPIDLHPQLGTVG